MKYELVYYEKGNKNVVLSDTLENIDKYIMEKRFSNRLTMVQYFNKIKDFNAEFKIVSNDDKYERKLLYFKELQEIYSVNLINELFYMYSNDPKFKKKFEKEILSDILNIKKNTKIKDLACDLIDYYPDYFKFRNFFIAYVNIKFKTVDNVNKTKYDYSKFRKLGELYITYKNEKINDGEKKHTKKYIIK